MRLRLAGSALVLLALGACGDRTGPDLDAFRIEAVSGNDQIGARGAVLEEALAVRVTDGGEPVQDIIVQWEVVEGAGARIEPTSSRTDQDGIARANLRLGTEVGRYEVHARIAGSSVPPVAFTARAILEPVVAAVEPARVAVGDVVTITGEHFSENPADVIVLFDGMRGTVIRAEPTRIEAVVPACVPTRTVAVTVRTGPVESATSAPLDVTGDGAPPIELAPGQVLSLSDPAAMECVRLPSDAGAMFLIVQQNAAGRAEQSLPYQVLALRAAGGGAAASVAWNRSGDVAYRLRQAGYDDAQVVWETHLRLNERTLLLGAPRRSVTPKAASVPRVGERKSFQVYNKEKKFSTVTAEVVHVGEHVVIYQDVDAPSGGLTAEDFAYFASLFDDPIYTTATSAFGQPSDIDGNGRVIILFTPVVNELTPANSVSGGVIAGFFYGIDLYPKQTYANSNEAEIFYMLVPDPTGRHGNTRSRDFVLRTVPPVLAHELQHMIHFEERRKVGGSQDVLWLSEGLAHMSEELVAAELERRADHTGALLFRRENHERAFRYLQAVDSIPDGVTLMEEENPGTLEGRGAQWLFIQYLAEQFGGEEILRALTRSTLDGVANVEAATGTAWPELLARWSVALWADGAPELAGVAIDPAYTFPDFDLRETIAGGRPFPLSPAVQSFADFSLDGSLPAGAASYLILSAGDGSAGGFPLHVSFTRLRGDAFRPDDRPRWTILRIR